MGQVGRGRAGHRYNSSAGFLVLAMVMLFASSNWSLSCPSNENGFVQVEGALEDKESSEALYCLFSPSHCSQSNRTPTTRSEWNSDLG